MATEKAGKTHKAQQEAQKANPETASELVEGYEWLDITQEEMERLNKLREQAKEKEAQREKHWQKQEAEKQAQLEAHHKAEAEARAKAEAARRQREAEARKQAQERAQERASKAAEVGRLRRRLLDLRTERKQAETAVHNAQVALGRVRGLSGDAEALDAARAEGERCKCELAEIEAAIDAVAAELAAANPGETVKGHRVVQMAGTGRR